MRRGQRASTVRSVAGGACWWRPSGLLLLLPQLPVAWWWRKSACEVQVRCGGTLFSLRNIPSISPELRLTGQGLPTFTSLGAHSTFLSNRMLVEASELTSTCHPRYISVSQIPPSFCRLLSHFRPSILHLSS